MKKSSDLKLILFFTALTFLLTVAVVFAWEKLLLPPFYSWVDANYPGEAYAQVRWKIQQRVEHFFISIAVDMVVVTLLLRVVRRQHRKVSESEARYRALFEHALDGIGVLNKTDGRLVEVNERFAEIFSSAPHELAGREIGELLATPARAELLRAWLFEGAETGERELTIRRGTGETLPVSVSFSTLEAGGQKLLILVLRDMSLRRRLEAEKDEMQQQLYQSAKLASLGELSAGVAHEINNPLNGIINFAQLLKDEDSERTEFERQLLNGIVEEGERIAQIVRGLLAFARHDEGEFGRVDVAETIRNSVALFGRQLEKDGVRVEVEVEPGLPLVRADGSRLRQVVVNLISNAHHALRTRGPEGGDAGARLFRIVATSAEREDGRTVRLEFYDNGTGIRRADLPRVFDPFFTTRRDAGGTGLGLSLSFGIIRDHGGTIRVESEEGRFTRFTVELPAAHALEVDYAQSPSG